MKKSIIAVFLVGIVYSSSVGQSTGDSVNRKAPGRDTHQAHHREPNHHKEFHLFQRHHRHHPINGDHSRTSGHSRSRHSEDHSNENANNAK